MGGGGETVWTVGKKGKESIKFEPGKEEQNREEKIGRAIGRWSGKTAKKSHGEETSTIKQRAINVAQPGGERRGKSYGGARTERGM